MNKKTTNTKFIQEISRIKDPEIFLGVARILHVPLVEQKDDKYVARNFYAMCHDIIVAYDAADRTRRRELLTILKQANKAKIAPAATTQEEKPDANRTENSEASISNKEV